jgi:hypothetical protein
VRIHGKCRIVKCLAHHDRSGLVTHTRQRLEFFKGGRDLREGRREGGKKESSRVNKG